MSARCPAPLLIPFAFSIIRKDCLPVMVSTQHWFHQGTAAIHMPDRMTFLARYSFDKLHY